MIVQRDSRSDGVTSLLSAAVICSCSPPKTMMSVK